MSASLVRKSLAIVDPDLNASSGKKKNKKKEFAIEVPQQHKLHEKIQRGQKVDTINLLKTTKKISINDLRKQKHTDKSNLKKIDLFRKLSKIELDKDTERLLFERASVRFRQKKKKKESKTVFTEEDFENFEKEYFIE